MEGLPPVATLPLQDRQNLSLAYENPRIVKAPPALRTPAGTQATRAKTVGLTRADA